MAGSELLVRTVDGPGSSATSPSFTSEKSPDNILSGQVAVGTSSTLVVAARAARKSVTLTPTSSVVYYVGPTGVSTTTGVYVAAGASITISTTAAVYAVGAAGFTLSYVETY